MLRLDVFEQFILTECSHVVSNMSLEIIGMLSLSTIIHVELGSRQQGVSTLGNGLTNMFGLILSVLTEGWLGSLVYSCLCLFMFICMLNMAGLVSYGYTLTSQFIVTLWLSLGVWLGKFILGYDLLGMRIVSVLLPSGVSMGLSVFLVVIELVSFIIPIISLSVRLFANLLSGHVLLKVIVTFSWSIVSIGILGIGLSIMGMLLLCSLYVLEFGVALVQGYVFSLLTGVYVNDLMKPHH